MKDEKQVSKRTYSCTGDYLQGDDGIDDDEVLFTVCIHTNSGEFNNAIMLASYPVTCMALSAHSTNNNRDPFCSVPPPEVFLRVRRYCSVTLLRWEGLIIISDMTGIS